MDVETFCDLVAVELGLAEVDPEARFVEDLGAESMDLVAVLAAVDDRFGIALDETVLGRVGTVRELFAAAEAAARGAEPGR